MIKGMAGGIIPVTGQMPEAGGVVDQSAWLMDAFEVIEKCYRELRPEG